MPGHDRADQPGLCPIRASSPKGRRETNTFSKLCHVARRPLLVLISRGPSARAPATTSVREGFGLPPHGMAVARLAAPLKSWSSSRGNARSLHELMSSFT
jgi:hypothetical protein